MHFYTRQTHNAVKKIIFLSLSRLDRNPSVSNPSDKFMVPTDDLSVENGFPYLLNGFV